MVDKPVDALVPDDGQAGPSRRVMGGEQAAIILRNCRAAVRDRGRALVVETVVGEIGKPDFAVLSDMGMPAVTGGMERDLEEFDVLFAASGWLRGKTYPVGGGYLAMELSAA